MAISLSGYIGTMDSSVIIRFSSLLHCILCDLSLISDIKNGNPVLASESHADIATVPCEKPVAQGGDICVGDTESFGLVRDHQSDRSGGTDSDDNRFLMYVITDAFWADHFKLLCIHKVPSFTKG